MGLTQSLTGSLTSSLTRSLTAAGGIVCRDWIPTDLSTDTLLAWFDGTDQATMSLSGTEIETWNDKSPNAYAATQSLAGQKPKVDQVTINGNGSVTFDVDHMITDILPASVRALITVSQYHTDDGIAIGARDSTDTRSYIGWKEDAGTPKNWIGVGNSSSRYGNDYPASECHVQYMSHNGTTIKSYLDGNAGINTSQTGGTGVTQPYYLGALNDQGSPLASSRFQGSTLGIVVLKAVPTDAEREDVEGWGAWFGGSQADLPADHKYINGKPIFCTLPNGDTVSVPETAELVVDAGGSYVQDESGNYVYVDNP